MYEINISNLQEDSHWRYKRNIKELLCNQYYNVKIGMIYLLTAIGLSHGGSSTVHIYTQTIHRTTQITTAQNK